MKAILVGLLVLGSVSAFAENGNHWKECNNLLAHGTTIPFRGIQKAHIFKQKCAPDTLYSWQNFNKKDLEKFRSHPFSGHSHLYTWRTPLGTFAYGDSQIRLKLKTDVEFKWIKEEERNCRNFPKLEKQKTVYVAVLSSMKGGNTEYLLCDPSVVETWSMNSVGAKLEAIKELEFIKSTINEQKKDEYNRPLILSYDRYGSFTPRREVLYAPFNNVNPYFGFNIDLETDWSPKKLEENLDRLGQYLDPEDGVVFPEPSSVKQRNDHFRSKINSYYQLSDAEILDLNL